MQALMKEVKCIQANRAASLIDPEEVSEYLKVAINNFLWGHLPARTTMADAEDFAAAIYMVLEKMYEGRTLKQIAEGN